MNERNLFRGKSALTHLVIPNGLWCTGSLVTQTDKTEIYGHMQGTQGDVYNWCIIDPATIGQCTGLRDKNGRLIFEGDIVRDEFNPDDIFSGTVRWSKRNMTWICSDDDKVRHILMIDFTAQDDINCRTMEIIGNIYDNPELLEVVNA